MTLLTTIILGILAFFLGLFEWNMAVYRPFAKKNLMRWPKVSVLIPCRDEAARIRENALSLIRQDYPDFEVIVMDDESTDGTDRILTELERDHPNFRWLKGKPLPPGWTGKNRACHELSLAARGEWLLFVDADTHHKPDMLKRAVGTAVSRRADLLSTFPRQRFGSLGDEMVVPLMFFILLMYLPAYFVSKRIWKWLGRGMFAAACGQYLLVKKDAYEKAGGHAAIRLKISEASLIATAVKKNAGRLLLLDGSRWVSCAMYRGFGEAFKGFSRSVFATMGGSVPALVFFLTLQTLVFHVPWGVLALQAASPDGFGTVGWMAVAAVMVPIWMRFRIHARTGMALKCVPLHAASILLYHVVMVNSFLHYRFHKNTSWKDRSYADPQS